MPVPSKCTFGALLFVIKFFKWNILDAWELIAVAQQLPTPLTLRADPTLADGPDRLAMHKHGLECAFCFMCLGYVQKRMMNVKATRLRASPIKARPCGGMPKTSPSRLWQALPPVNNRTVYLGRYAFALNSSA
jgi:hypothetical protein